MKLLSQFKKEMRIYFRDVVDAEESETFTMWFDCLMDCLKEDKKISVVGNKTYILD